MSNIIDLKQYGITIKAGFGFFWGGVLSNWYKAKFTVDNIKFTSTEQHMMYNKALLFNDMITASKILKTQNTKDIKALGREVKNFSKPIWDQMSSLIVLEGNYEKYIQNDDLANILLATGEVELVEASPYDKIWGIGLAVDHPDVTDKTKWLGENRLGKTLNDVRAEVALTRKMA